MEALAVSEVAEAAAWKEEASEAAAEVNKSKSDIVS